MPSYREDGEFGEQLMALLPHYSENKTNVLRAAVALLYWMHTDEKIGALLLDLDLERRDVLTVAVAELWQREIGEPDRDVLAELDELKRRLDELSAA